MHTRSNDPLSMFNYVIHLQWSPLTITIPFAHQMTQSTQSIELYLSSEILKRFKMRQPI